MMSTMQIFAIIAATISTGASIAQIVCRRGLWIAVAAWAVMWVLIIGNQAHAADKALILNDADQQKLVRVIDTALKSQGVAIIGDAADVLSKLLKAPAVTEAPVPQEPSPLPPPAPPAPKDPQP
jgi:hypothetical protein